jgi:hypothetical protein
MSSGVDDKQAGPEFSQRELKDYASEQVDVLQAVNTVAGTLYRELGLDWYQVLAAAMFQVDYNDVTRTQRTNAKIRYFNATNWALQDKGML